MARRALARVTPAAEAKRVLLQVDVEPDLPSCETDASRVEQILINLLGNAIGHTPGGSTVRVYVTARGPWVVYTVEDAGPGNPGERGGADLRHLRHQGRGREPRGRVWDCLCHAGWPGCSAESLRAVAQPGRGGRFVLELPATPEHEESFIRRVPSHT